jgi:hypothetical protein
VLVQSESFLNQVPNQLKLLLVDVLVRCDLEPFDIGIDASFQASFGSSCYRRNSLRDIGSSGTDPRLGKICHLTDVLSPWAYVSFVLCEAKSFDSSGAHLCGLQS